MDKNELQRYLSMLWQGQLTPLKMLKVMKRDGFYLINKRDKKILLSLFKDIEKNRLFINDELLEEIIKMNGSQSSHC